mmetsp:Transcript_11521/g.30396  ORF Transcript_11521/g.30396 Transcript_11521/m.30396 type:complete len:293 (-) Transcript_11521:12-890(-)
MRLPVRPLDKPHRILFDANPRPFARRPPRVRLDLLRQHRRKEQLIGRERARESQEPPSRRRRSNHVLRRVRRQNHPRLALVTLAALRHLHLKPLARPPLNPPAGVVHRWVDVVRLEHPRERLVVHFLPHPRGPHPQKGRAAMPSEDEPDVMGREEGEVGGGHEDEVGPIRPEGGVHFERRLKKCGEFGREMKSGLHGADRVEHQRDAAPGEAHPREEDDVRRSEELIASNFFDFRLLDLQVEVDEVQVVGMVQRVEKFRKVDHALWRDLNKEGDVGLFGRSRISRLRVSHVH